MPIVDLTTFPLKYSAQHFWIEGGDASSGAGLDGREQIVYTENRRWVGQISFPNASKQAARYLISIGDRLRGRAYVMRLPLHNIWGDPWDGDLERYLASLGYSESEVAHGSTPFSDETRFEDGAGFALPDGAEPVVVSDAVAGSSQIDLSGYRGRNLPVSAMFSIEDFLYRVEENDDGAVSFSPPLRQAVSAGAEISINTPVIRVRLEGGSAWRPKVRPGKTVEPFSVKVVEAFDR